MPQWQCWLQWVLSVCVGLQSHDLFSERTSAAWECRACKLTVKIHRLHTSIYARDKKSLRKVFHDASNLGLNDVGDLDTIVKQQTKSIILRSFQDNDHFIHDFIERCPSGRLRHVKYRSSWGKDCLLCQMTFFFKQVPYSQCRHFSSKRIWRSMSSFFLQQFMFVIANKSINQYHPYNNDNKRLTFVSRHQYWK